MSNYQLPPTKEIHTFLREFVLEGFYQKRFEKLNKIKFEDIFSRKNPYLFKAKNLETPEKLVKSVLYAFLSSAEETTFGNYMEEFAIWLANKMYGGQKVPESKKNDPEPKYKSIDLIFERDNIFYQIGIKSGPNWGNSDQVGKMKVSFKENIEKWNEYGFEKIGIKPIKKQIISINGCIYGKDNFYREDKDQTKSYYKLCGQEFWYFITKDEDFYKEIIKPAQELAEEKTSEFKQVFKEKIIELTSSMYNKFVDNNNINWGKLLEFVSENKKERLDINL